MLCTLKSRVVGYAVCSSIPGTLVGSCPVLSQLQKHQSVVLLPFGQLFHRHYIRSQAQDTWYLVPGKVHLVL